MPVMPQPYKQRFNSRLGIPAQQPDSFQSSGKTSIKFDTELIRCAGEKFVQASEQDSSADNVESSYEEYLNTINPELSKYKPARHTYFNMAAKTIDFEDYDIDLKTSVKQLVEQANAIIETYQLLLESSIEEDTHTKAQIFNLALETLKNQTKGRQINIKNREYLENLGKCSKPIKDYQIFLNLIENALKYSPAGSPIDIEFASKEKYYKYANLTVIESYFIIKDRGIGIPPKEIKKVLCRGVRGSNTGDIPGTGMGLQAVVAYDRDIEITSPLYPDEPVYKGTRIKVKIDEQTV